MNSEHNRDRYIQAGEYVVGTLPNEAVKAFLRQLDHDILLQQAVIEWQEKLQPLAHALPVKIPPPGVWQGICRRLSIRPDINPQNTRLRTRGSEELLVDDLRTDRLVSAEHRRSLRRLDNKLVRWRMTGSLAMAASAVLAFSLWQNIRQPDAQQSQATVFESFVLLNPEQSSTAYLIQASVTDKKMRVTAVAPPAVQSDQDLQLWLVLPNDGGVRSLGLLPEAPDATILLDVPDLTAEVAAVAVSLEPAGGSTLAGPSGDVIFQGEIKSASAER